MVVLVYLGWLIVASLFGLEQAYADSNYRRAAFFLLQAGIRYWIFVGVARPATLWVVFQGVLATGGALADLGLRMHGAFREPLATMAAKVNTLSPGRFWVGEMAVIITAICCWILDAELKRRPPRGVEAAQVVS